MGAWNIDPAAVQVIIDSETNLANSDLYWAVNGVGLEADNAVEACTRASTGAPNGNAVLVASALQTFFENRETSFGSMSTTVTNVLNNTANAVNAYLNHDEEAALEFQRQAK